MGRLLTFLYGVVAYAAFVFSFLYAIGFVGNIIVPKSIDSGTMGSLGTALLVNLGLLGLFAVQHSVMARKGFKRWWTRVVPPAAERSTYVLLSSAILLLLFWQWQPITGAVWTVESEAGVTALHAIFWLGWAIVFLGSFGISHFDLFGLRQVWTHLRGREYEPPDFQVSGFYRHVRHPLMLGFLLAFWATPEMTVGHLLFATATTGYILVGVWFEERDLIDAFGEKYRAYRRETAMLIPGLGGRGSGAEPPGPVDPIEPIDPAGVGAPERTDRSDW